MAFHPKAVYKILPHMEPGREYTSMELQGKVDMPTQSLRIQLAHLVPYYLERRKIPTKKKSHYTFMYHLTPFGEDVRAQLLNIRSKYGSNQDN